MRKIFADTYIKLFAKKTNSIFLTGDLGFMALENVRRIMKKRFINAGVAEQNMVSVAAGMASEGLRPFVYSIAPFISLKNTEQIRNDIAHIKLPVTLVGNGGGYGYGIMGPTHHVLEDLSLFTSLPAFTSYIPGFDEDILPQLKKIQRKKTPSYLRLGLAKKHSLKLPQYEAVRNINRGSGVTLFVLGPLIHNVLEIQELDSKLYKKLDIWLVSELPSLLPQAAHASVQKTGSVIIIEEHVQSGGLATCINEQLLEKKSSSINYLHLYAQGYPSNTYGDQLFHQRESRLDPESIIKSLRMLIA
jgi:transketolase